MLWMEKQLYTAAFSGYRPDKPGYPKDSSGVEALRLRLNGELRRAVQRGYHTFYSGAARGFDILAGEEVLQLRKEFPELHLVCAVPFAGQQEHWAASWQQRYLRLLDAADEVVEVSTRYTRTCYHERNRLMVDRSSLLICLFDGQPGGTAYTVEYAMKRGLEIINLAESACTSVKR